MSRCERDNTNSSNSHKSPRKVKTNENFNYLIIKKTKNKNSKKPTNFPIRLEGKRWNEKFYEIKIFMKLVPRIEGWASKAHDAFVYPKTSPSVSTQDVFSTLSIRAPEQTGDVEFLRNSTSPPPNQKNICIRIEKQYNTIIT